MRANWPDDLEAFDRIGPSRDLWSEAIARAESRRHRGSRRPRGVPWMRSAPRRTFISVGLAVLAVGSAGSALAYHYLGPSPGLTAGLSSFDTLPQASWPASQPTDVLGHAAAAVGITTNQAAQGLRLLQTDLPLGTEGKGDLYGLKGSAGTGCVFLTGPASGSICLTKPIVSNPALDGVAWADVGGNSAQTPGPLAVYGLAADNVREIDVVVSGVAQGVPIVNNSFYAEDDAITSTDSIMLITHFDDGTTHTFNLPNPYSGT